MPRAKRRRTFSLTRVLDTVATDGGGLVSHNMRVGARRTSFRLDDLTWRSLHEMARREGMAVHDLSAMIQLKKPPALSLTVAIRVAVLQYYCVAARGRRSPL